MNGYFCVINGTVSFKHPLQSIQDFAKVVLQINGFSTAVFQSPLLKEPYKTVTEIKLQEKFSHFHV